MDDHLKTTDQLIAELTQLRQRVAELETAQAERQQTEAEREASLAVLRENETRWRHITDNMLDVVGLTDLRGVYQYVSPSVKAVAGYEPSEIMGLTMFDHVHPDDLFRVIRVAMRALHAGQTGRMELRYQHADGHYVMLEAVGTPARDGAGRIIGAVMSARDVTARKQAEDALRESEERYRAVAYSATEAIVSADDAGTIVGWNRGATAIFGYTAAEIIGQPLTRLLPARYQAEHLAGMQRLQAGGERHIIGQTVELVGRRQDGREFFLELSLAEWVVKTRTF
jgi:PAS domain S-box-containing protein